LTAERDDLKSQLEKAVMDAEKSVTLKIEAKKLINKLIDESIKEINAKS
jgi:hypothetical protein